MSRFEFYMGNALLLIAGVGLCGWIATRSGYHPAAPYVPVVPPQQGQQGIQVRLVEDPVTGDYKLYVSGGRQTVCEEKDVQIVQQPDYKTDLVIECSHAK